MGDVALQNLIDPAVIAQIDVLADPPILLTATAPTEVGVYGFPMAMWLPPDATIPEGAVITVDGRTNDNQWLRFYLDGSVAWVQVADVVLAGNLEQLDVVDPISFEVPLPGEPGIVPHITPFQAFDFQSSTTWCGDMPAAGLLVQTPAGPGRTWLMVNDIELTARDATFIMQTNFSLQVLAGSVQVAAGGGGEMVPQGQQTSVPMGTDGRASGQPSTPTSATIMMQTLTDMDLPLTPLIDPIDELELVPLVDDAASSGPGLAPIVIENTRWITQGEVVIGGWKSGWTVPFMVDDQLRIVSANGMSYITYAGICVQVFDAWPMRVGGRVANRQFQIIYFDQGAASSDNIRWLPCDLPALLEEAMHQVPAVFSAVDLLVALVAQFNQLSLPVMDGASIRVEVGGAYALGEVYFDRAPAAARSYGERGPTPPEVLQMLDQEHRNNVIRQYISIVLGVFQSR
jgi:hypothetical protein